ILLGTIRYTCRDSRVAENPHQVWVGLSPLKSEACCLNHGQLMFAPNQSMEHMMEKLAELSVLRWLGMKSRLGSLGVQRGWSRLTLCGLEEACH
ncbi:hypothetical protein PIB30_106608, partial [Stylosanthes scabra]|nr:hypothetical protein [Stylosanthes scabra]